MNGIFSRSSENKLHGILSPKNTESVETAGSLAMNQFHSLFETNVYDVFSSSNPFAVDYSLYSDSGESIAFGGGFLSGFSNAMSVLSTGGGFSDSGSFTGASCGFSSGVSCGTSSGGFSSFC